MITVFLILLVGFLFAVAALAIFCVIRSATADRPGDWLFAAAIFVLLLVPLYSLLSLAGGAP